MKKKKNTILKLILILILIILFIKIFFLKGLQNTQKNDYLLFFKLFSNEESLEKKTQNKEDENLYYFKIDYKNMEFRSINLANTIDRETLIYEKIAPGTSGNFNILLDSNKNLKYKIEFNSTNEKPYNLNFKALKDGEILGEANTLEELSEKLTGYINQNEKINITINWYWNYENKENQENTDIQDTKDSENIKNYRFNVCVLGGELN